MTYPIRIILTFFTIAQFDIFFNRFFILFLFFSQNCIPTYSFTDLTFFFHPQVCIPTYSFTDLTEQADSYPISQTNIRHYRAPRSYIISPNGSMMYIRRMQIFVQARICARLIVYTKMKPPPQEFLFLKATASLYPVHHLIHVKISDAIYKFF